MDANILDDEGKWNVDGASVWAIFLFSTITIPIFHADPWQEAESVLDFDYESVEEGLSLAELNDLDAETPQAEFTLKGVFRPDPKDY